MTTPSLPSESPCSDRSASQRLGQQASHDRLQSASAARSRDNNGPPFRGLPDRNDLINDRRSECDNTPSRDHPRRHGDGQVCVAQERRPRATFDRLPVHWAASSEGDASMPSDQQKYRRQHNDRDDDDDVNDENISSGSAGAILRTAKLPRTTATTKTTMCEGSRRAMARPSSVEPPCDAEIRSTKSYSQSSPASMLTETDSPHWSEGRRKRRYDDADDMPSRCDFDRDDDEQQVGEATEVEEDELQSDNELSVQDVSTSSITSANSFFSPMSHRTPLGKTSARSNVGSGEASAFDRSATLGSATSMEDDSSPGSAKREQDEHRGRDGSRLGYDDKRAACEMHGVRLASSNGDTGKTVDANSDAAAARQSVRPSSSSSSSSPISAEDRSSRPQYTVTMLSGAPQRKSCDRCFRMKTKCSRAAPGASNDKPCEGCIRRGFGHDCVTSRPDFPQPRITLAKRPRREDESGIVLPAQSSVHGHQSARSMDVHPRHSTLAGANVIDAGRAPPLRQVRRGEQHRPQGAADAAGHGSFSSLQHPDRLVSRRPAAAPPLLHEPSRYAAATDGVRHFRPTFAPIQHNATRRADSNAYDPAARSSVAVTSRYESVGVAWSDEHKSKSTVAAAAGETPSSSILAAMRASHHAESVCQALPTPTRRGGYGLPPPPPPTNRLHSMRTDELRDALIVIAEELAKRAAAPTMMASATEVGVGDAPPVSAASSSSVTSPSTFQSSPHMHRGQ